MATNALAVDTKQIESKLLTLKERAEAIVVKDAESYAIACQIVLDGRAEVKAIGFVLDPGINSAKAHLDTLRNQKTGYVGRITPVIEAAEHKAEVWKAEERRRAQAEQDRINEQRRADAARKAAEERKAAEAQAEADRKERERQAELVRKEREKEIEAQRKSGEIGKREAEKQKKAEAEEAEREKKRAAEEATRQRALAAEQEQITRTTVQEVKVAPSVPKVAGIKARVNWKFTVINEALIPRSFSEPNLVAIGSMVREEKDKERAEARCPGIRVYSEDSV